jgi:muramoyltetrapeptide carboxypeptidase LdcA involved in peptidoglycan recycling
MSPSQLTAHAQRRKQQRGISDLQVQLIQVFGEDHYQKGGATLSYVPEKRLMQLRQAIERLSGVVIIKGSAEDVVTIMHLDQRVGRTEYAA